MLKSFIQGTLLTLLGLAIALLLLEAGTRFYFSNNLDYQIEMSRYAAGIKQRAENPAMSHRHRPESEAFLMGVPVSINSAGFRDREYPLEKPDDVYRIMLLGDSLTFGWGVEADKRFSDILEQELNSRNSDGNRYRAIEVINTGIGNYNTSQEVTFFSEFGRQWQPDMVILNYFINDAEPTPTKRAPALFRHSYLGMLLWGRFDILSRRYLGEGSFDNYYAELYDDAAAGWQATREAMQNLADMGRSDGFNLIMFILPELHAVGPEYHFADVHAKVRSAAEAGGITQIYDLAEYFRNEEPRSLWVSLDDAHPNDKAHRILADAMLEHLSKSSSVVWQQENTAAQ